MTRVDVVTVLVRLTPRGGRDALEGVDAEGRLLARVAAPPLEGAANRALVRLVADAAGVAPSDIELEAGARGRIKRLRIGGLRPDEARARWPGVAIL